MWTYAKIALTQSLTAYYISPMKVTPPLKLLKIDIQTAKLYAGEVVVCYKKTNPRFKS